MATRKRKKRKTTKKAAAPQKSTRRDIRAQVDHTKDPVYKLKPNDIVRYTPIAGDGEMFPPEIHIVLQHTYDRDPDRISSHPTLELKEGKLCANTLYFWGKEACKVEVLNESFRVELSVIDGQHQWKLLRKRAKKAA